MPSKQAYHKNPEKYREEAKYASHVRHSIRKWDKATIELCLSERSVC